MFNNFEVHVSERVLEKNTNADSARYRQWIKK